MMAWIQNQRSIPAAILCFALFLFTQLSTDAQSQFLKVSVNGGKPEWAQKLKPEMQNREGVLDFLAKEIQELREAGFQAASLDTLIAIADTFQANIYTGEKLRFSKIKLNGNALKTLDYPMSYGSYLRWRDQLLKSFTETGFPFARLVVDEWEKSDSGLEVNIGLDKGPFIVFDSIVVKGNQANPAFLSRYLSIKKGAPFNALSIEAIPDKIEELEMFSMQKGFDLQFRGGEADVILYLKKQKNNRFNLLLGLSPSNEITGKLLLTGDLDLELNNYLGSGEKLHFHFEQFERSTKKIEIYTEYPYLAILPFGFDAGFELFLKDSLYLNRNFAVGIKKSWTASRSLRFFYENKISNVLSFDTARIILEKRLPAILDFSKNIYGLESQWAKLDYFKNPRKGLRMKTKIGVGFKKVNSNNLVTDLNDPLDPAFDFETLYDSVNQNNRSLIAELQASYHLPLFKRSSLAFLIDGGFLEGGRVSQNENYRLGGQKRLRGFDDDFFSASLFGILGMEYRFLYWAGRNSSLYAFSELAYFEDRALQQTLLSRTISTGIGMNLQTKAGIFGLGYALGKRNQDPIQFRNAKIHFGYINYF